MGTYFNLYCLAILCGLVLKSYSQFLFRPPKYYTTKTEYLRCNCKTNRQCGNNGTCSPDVCAWPYVGRNCQHASIALLNSTLKVTNVPTKLTDGNDSTCLSKLLGTELTYELNNTLNFIWVYMSWKSTYHMKPRLTLYNNHRIQSIDEYILKLSDKSILIRLRKHVLYTKLKLSDLPPDLCSVEVSIGRNLAISSTPDQNSVLSTLNSTTKQNAQRAISGSDNRTFENKRLTHCTHTSDPPYQHEWWQTLLKYDAVVNSVFILNRDGFESSLSYFFVETFDSSSNLVYTHKNRHEYWFYSFPVAAEKWVKRVKLTLDTNAPSRIQFANRWGTIMICEIYIFGEFRCPVNKYGPVCERDCPKGCTREKCDPDWGCPDGCNNDWAGIWCDKDCVLRYGPECTLLCPDGCAGIGDCNTTTGACLDGCKPGLYTAMCTEPCRPSTFGQNCSKICSHCEKNKTTKDFSCDAEFGECLLGCGEGFLGENCEKIIVQDDVLIKSTKYTLAGFVALAILLLFKSATRPSDDVLTTTADTGEEQRLVPTEPDVKEPEPGILGSLAETSADPQTTQDGPNLMEEPVKTELKNSEVVNSEKVIKSSNESQVTEKKPKLIGEPAQTELKSSDVVNTEKLIESSNGSQIRQKESNRMEEPVKTEPEEINAPDPKEVSVFYQSWSLSETEPDH